MQRQRQLNQSQLELLHVLYRFRFGTRSLLAEYLKRPNNTSLYSKLSILEKYGVIATRYDKSYKLAGREAEYYVTPKGVRALNDAGVVDITDKGLQTAYRDKTVTDSYLRQLILLFTLRNQLCAVYPELQFFTARDIQDLDYFPKKRPTAFISLKTDKGIKRFFVEYIPMQTSVSIIKGKLKRFTVYYEEDGWSVTDTPFPTILYICEDGMTEQGVRWHIKRALYMSDTDMQYYTTTQKAILGSLQSAPAVWSDVSEPDNLLSLPEL
ncbi:MAG: hypothetical protein WAR37_04005 [Candidatus Microsaccharimonas sp.]